jgi:hypothetical protein
MSKANKTENSNMRNILETAKTLIVALAVLAIVSAQAIACPFCSAPSLTMSEQLSQADAVVLVQWFKGVKPTEDTPGSTTYEIKRINQNYKNSLKVGGKVVLSRYRSSQLGDLFMLLGNKGITIDWGSPIEVSEASFDYIAKCPSPEIPTVKRLAFYSKFLEHSDQLIANDAYGEFANAPYKDIVAVADKLPAEKIRQWVLSDDTPQTRLGLYGLLIGLSGNEKDVKVLEAKVLEKSEEFRLGVDGLMSGYLILTGAKGLEILDEHKLRNLDVPFSETYAAMQALRFMWRHGEGRIEKDRLRQSMRVLLDRPELTDLVIADLARWKDWSVQGKLMKMYGEGEFNVPSIKRAIVRYMLVSSKAIPEEAVAGNAIALPNHVTKGRKLLAELRKRDPKTVAKAERFFLPY